MSIMQKRNVRNFNEKIEMESITRALEAKHVSERALATKIGSKKSN